MPDAPTYKSVTIYKNGGDVSIKVTNPNSPQSINGVTWEYSAHNTPPVNKFPFTTANPENILGKPAAIDQHLFWVDGAVRHIDDGTPTSYQVQIEITQDGKQLDLTLQPPTGPGQISTTDITISYRFQLLAA